MTIEQEFRESVYKYFCKTLDNISANTLEELYEYWATGQDLYSRLAAETDYLAGNPALQRECYRQMISLWSYERTGSDFVQTRNDTLVRRKYYRAFPWETYPEHPKAKKLRHDYPSDLVQIKSINEITVY